MQTMPLLRLKYQQDTVSTHEFMLIKVDAGMTF